MNPEDNTGSTLRHLAASEEICEFTIRKIVDKNPADINGETPLHFAAQNGHYKSHQIIFQNVFDRNPRNILGYFPLHVAALHGHFEIFVVTLPNVQDKNP